ncbi:MAG: type 4a pilus biogenesis protein PilO [Methylococcaceae bacterium]|jgi:type IV pilus assembly protein PilO
MNLSEISWDLEYAGSWPVAIKTLVVAVLCLLLSALWYHLDTAGQFEQLEATQAREAELRATFEIRQRKASNLDEYKEQLLDIEKTFGELLRQLPDRTQVPELLVDVSQTGLASGLEFELFKPGTEVTRDFYAELPIEVRVLGTFFDFGSFVSSLASLPRIVTVHNIKIAPNLAKESGGQSGPKYPLTMSALVRTYRYLDEGELALKPTAKSAAAKP